jgi:PHS family inorganic phosphate transporter-like MFS transporter
LINIGGKGKFLPHILEIFALFMLTGVFSTLLLPETKNRSLEELSDEPEEFEVYTEGRVERSNKTQ